MKHMSNQYASAAELQLMEGFPPSPDKRVSRANALLNAPYNRWSYLNMRMIYPSAGIANADEPSPIKTSIDQGIAGLAIGKPDEDGNPTDESVDMETYLLETYTDAFVVVKGDQIVFERYLNGMHPGQPHQMMSATKSFTGLFGLMAVEEGHGSESDPIIKHVPELEVAGAFSDATFGQVLDMTNSMDFDEVYSDPASAIRRYGVVLGLMDPVEGQTYAGSIYEYLQTLQKDPRYEHGEIFHYQTPKTDVVNWVTNRLTGESFQDNMYDKLWSKLGTDGETYVLLDKDATLFAGGGLNAPPHDLARFAMMMLNDGRFNGQQVVSPAVIKKLSDGASREKFAKGPDAVGIMSNGEWSYRAQWWVRHTPGREAFAAAGIHGQHIYIDVHRDLAIVKLSSQPVSYEVYETAYDFQGFDAIVDYLRAR